MKSFTELTGKEKFVELLQWICVLPAAWLGDYAGYAIGGILGWLAVTVGLVNPPSDDSALNRSLRYLIWMFPQGVACVIASAKTAPRWRRATASVAAVVWILWIDRIHGFEGVTYNHSLACYLIQPVRHFQGFAASEAHTSSLSLRANTCRFA